MALIRSKGNKATELTLAAIFRAAGVTGWRRHVRMPGTADFVFPRARIAVFVDGCFWHGCRWHCRMPKTRKAFWTAKIACNRDRDRAVGVLLRKRGWRVLRVWEHSLREPAAVIRKFQSALASMSRTG